MARELTAEPRRRAAMKSRAAAVSVGSNALLVALKLAAGVITGSVAILTEAMHSAIDLVASLIALFSVRKASEPADESHRYGHEKIENLAAAIEGVLILAGSGVIVFESVRRLSGPIEIESVPIGIGVIAFSMALNVAVSSYLSRVARATGSPALEGDSAHLRTDVLTSLGVFAGLVAVELTGEPRFDPIVALIVAAVIVSAGVRLLTRSSRVLVDEALPAYEVEPIRAAVRSFADRGVVGYHDLRTRRAGARRYVDLHVQFRSGMTLEQAHWIAHELQDEIGASLEGDVDVLIHLEPEDRVRPGARIAGEQRADE